MGFKYDKIVTTSVVIFVAYLGLAVCQQISEPVVGDEETEREAFVQDNSRLRHWGCLAGYAVGVIYAFVGIILLAKYYFIPSLNVICVKSDTHEDIIGATFVAVGLSFHRLLFAFLSSFVSSDDSTLFATETNLFNVLFLVGLCALLGKRRGQLTCWPLVRDCGFILIAGTVLTLVSLSGTLEWWELFLLASLAIPYCLLLKFDESPRALIGETCCKGRKGGADIETHSQADLSIENGVGMKKLESKEMPLESPPTEGLQLDECNQGGGLTMDWPKDTLIDQSAFIFSLPLRVPFFCTLPDTTTPRGKKYYIWGYIGSLIWIAILSDVMMWAADPGPRPSLAGAVLQFLVSTAGSPLLIVSLFLARQCRGTVIAHAGLGSVIFHFCVQIPLPLLLHAILYEGPVHVNSMGIYCEAAILFGMLAVFITTVMISSFQMSRYFGAGLMVFYVTLMLVRLLRVYEIVSCPF